MDRRGQENRRMIERFTSKPINENLKTVLKISRFLMGFLVSFAIYLIAILVVEGKSSLAQSLIGGGAMLFTAFRLKDLNDKINFFLENESVTNLERSTHALTLLFLMFTFLVVLGTLALVIVYSDYFMTPLQLFS